MSYKFLGSSTMFLFGGISFLATLAISDATPSGCGCGTERTQLVPKSVELTDLSSKASEVSNSFGKEANDAIKAVRIDTQAVRDWIQDQVKGLGWGADRIASAVSNLIGQAEGKLNGQKDAIAAQMIADAKSSFDADVAKLTPKAKFQADCKWKERCCSEASWTGGAANRAGVYGAEGEGKAELKFSIGATAGITATTEASGSVNINGNLKLSGFNPVRPVTGNGSSITITATPTYEWTVKASGGGGILLKITVGGGLTGGDTLEDISGTLNCPG